MMALVSIIAHHAAVLAPQEATAVQKSVFSASPLQVQLPWLSKIVFFVAPALFFTLNVLWYAKILRLAIKIFLGPSGAEVGLLQQLCAWTCRQLWCGTQQGHTK
jgi:hypothetical protein